MHADGSDKERAMTEGDRERKTDRGEREKERGRSQNNCAVNREEYQVKYIRETVDKTELDISRLLT